MTERKKINLSPKISNPLWELTPWRMDSFWLVVTPKIFEWLRWTVTLAAVTYVQKKTGSVELNIFIILCYLCLWGYFNAYFYQIELINFPFIKKQTVQQFLSFTISGLLGVCTWWLVTFSIRAITDAPHITP